MNQAYLLIGGNMGDRAQLLEKAAKAIEDTCGRIVHRSSVYETAAWGKQDQEAFLNQALQIRTGLTAQGLLKGVLEIEAQLGRERREKYGPRLIDIDILLFNDSVIHLRGLDVPHPRMQDRRFVLEPLAEIAADLVHPVLHKTIRQLLAECPDALAVNKFS